MSKKIMVISRHAPYGSNLAREALDVALAIALFDQEISLLFMDDGIFQLLNNQDSGDIQQKNIAANLSALPLYGVESIYVHSHSMEMRNITTSDLIIQDIKLINDQQVIQLMQQQDQLLSF